MRKAIACVCWSWLIVATAAAGLRAADAAVGQPGQAIDDFQLRDYRGKEHALGEWAEKPVLVVAFLGTECPLAKLYAPRLAELSRQYAKQGVGFVGIASNQQDSVTELAAYARVHGVEFPLLKDPDNRVADQFDARRTPEVFVLDRARTIRYRGRIDDQYGFTQLGQNYQQRTAKRRDLVEALEAVLAGRPVEVASTEPPGCLIGRRREPAANADVTYAGQVAKILNTHCVECHRGGQIAPFPLTNYDEVAGWAEMIREVTQQRRMPPWHADPGVGHWANDHRLSDQDMATLARWVELGAPQGDPAQTPPVPTFAEGWGIPEPDQVIYMGDEAFTVPAEGVVEYQHFIVDPGWTEDKWIAAIEPRPGNPAVVHHILIFVQKPRDAKPGRAGRIGNEFLGAYAPGFRQVTSPEDIARFVPAGSKLVFQMHYTPNGSPQSDRSALGIKFADPSRVRKELVVQSSANYTFEIPPNNADYAVEGAYTFARDSDLVSLMPHMHLRGKAFRYVARYPDGREEEILNVPHYDFGWQTDYYLAEPKRMPKGTRLLALARFDNSADNLNNPDPQATVRFGEQTWEEMMIGFFQMTLADQDLTKPEEIPVARVTDFRSLYQATGGEFTQDLVQTAKRALDLEDIRYFYHTGRLLSESVMPQLDRLDITYVEDGKLRLWRIIEHPDFRGAFRSESTVLHAEGQALAAYAQAAAPVVNHDLEKLSGSVMRQMARKGVRSSLHIPLAAHGRRGSLNLWSTDAEAFPPEAVEIVQKLVGLMLSGLKDQPAPDGQASAAAR